MVSGQADRLSKYLSCAQINAMMVALIPLTASAVERISYVEILRRWSHEAYVPGKWTYLGRYPARLSVGTNSFLGQNASGVGRSAQAPMMIKATDARTLVRPCSHHIFLR